jgi:PmbA protein
VRQTPHGVYVAQLGGGQVNTATGDFVFGMTEAYLIEDGHITEPLRDANLIGNGPEVLRNIDVVGNDFAMGMAGDVRQAGPRGAGRRRPAHPAGQRPDRGRHGPVSGGNSDLLELATRVAGWARDGEQVEAYVARGRETEVRVYEGEVESLSSAESAGIGIRVVSGSRQGFAYAGSLDADVVHETLDEARDNAGFASPDEWVGLAGPDGVAPADLDLWRDDLAAYPTDVKVARALELERAVRAGDSRIRAVESAEWGDAAVESAVASSTGIRASSRRTVCYLSASAVAGSAADTQTGSGYSVGRSPDDLDLDKAAGDAVRRATRLLGAVKPHSAHLSVVFEPEITATLLAVIGGTLDGEAVLKGRSLFADRVGEEVSVGAITLVDDPTDPEAYGAARFDAEGLATRRNVLIEAGVLRVPVQHLFGPAGRDGFDRFGGAGRFQECARHRGPGFDGGARAALARGDPGLGRRRPVRAVRVGGAFWRQPRQRGLLGRGRRGADPGRGAGRPGSGVYHRLHDPAHAEWGGGRGLGSRAPPFVGRRPDAGDRRCIDERRVATTEKAILAGGCFWGMQDLIRKRPGVLSTRVGYTGGDVANATYRNHGSTPRRSRSPSIHSRPPTESCSSSSSRSTTRRR